jgi:hypothetical protein
MLETMDSIACVTLDASVVERARQRYPGYLQVNAALYAGGWARVAEK